MKTNPLLKGAEEYVLGLFRDKLANNYVYHNFQHTLSTVKACKKLAKEYELSGAEIDNLLFAAYFHDSGYIQTYTNHEDESIKIMKEFLQQKISNTDLAEIENLILSTKHGVKPAGILQEILHDADFVSMGSEDFCQRADLLRIEWERTLNQVYSELDWAKLQLQFLINTPFITKAANELYDTLRQSNIIAERKLIDKLEKKEIVNKQKEKTPAQKEGRGIETLYRSVYSYHISLTSIADNKANIMISINTIIISLVITLFGTGFTFSTDGEISKLRYIYPMIFLLLSSLVAAVFAILSARPNVTSKERYDLNKKESSILFFGNFAQLQLNEFISQIKYLKDQKSELYDNMSVDIYHLGSVLVKKYRLLTWSYNIFMAGMILCAMAFVIITAMSR